MLECECEELLKQGNSKKQYLLSKWVCTNGKKKDAKKSLLRGLIIYGQNYF